MSGFDAWLGQIFFFLYTLVFVARFFFKNLENFQWLAKQQQRFFNKRATKT